MKFSLNFLRLGCAAGGAAVGVYGLANSDKFGGNTFSRYRMQVKAAMQDNYYQGTGSKWDYNWDRREPKQLVKPLKEGATPEQEATYTKKVEEAKSKASRVIVMVRHGQYNLKGKNDSERFLSDLGKEQADLTGKRIAVLHDHLKSRTDENGNIVPVTIKLTKSTMTRATETANIILKHLKDVPEDSCDLIREGAPIEPDPPLDSWSPDPCDFFQEGPRIEAGFRKYFHRASPQQEDTSVEVVVCHGNVIRYCVCRALQLPPEAWLRLAVHNGSITVLTVTPSGRVKLTQLGETGHLPPNLLTFN